MATANKAQVILEAWSEFIRLEDMSNAQVSVSKARTNGVELHGNHVLIEVPLFLELQKSYARKGQVNQNPLVLSFPQLSKVEKGKEFLCPLFSVDITSIFNGPHQADGWNIERFKVAEAGGHLSKFLRLDDDTIENLVTREGLRRFLETTFDIAFDSFAGWMNSAPNYFQFATRAHAKPYVFEFPGSGFSFNLKKDLTDIQKASLSSWISPHSLAYKYLFTTPIAPKENQLCLGAFSGPHWPNASQLKALKHTQTEPMTAVQGPPGSGKTTLILHLIAQEIVSRAISIIDTGIDEGGVTVVSSKNKQAVSNVIDRLEAHKAKEGGLESCLCLRGGSKADTNRNEPENKGAAIQLREVLGKLDQLHYDAEFQESLAIRITRIKQDLVAKEQSFISKKQQLEQNALRQQSLLQAWQTDRVHLETATATIPPLEAELSRLSYVSTLPQNIYKRLQLRFETAKMQLPDSPQGRKRGWFSKLFGKTDRQILGDMMGECTADIGSTLGTPFEITLPTTREELSRQSQRIKEGLAQLSAFNTVQTQLVQSKRAIASLNQSLQEHRVELERLDAVAGPSEDFYATFHIHYHDQQQALFTLSRQFLLQEALKQKAALKSSLKRYQGVLPGASSQSKNVRDMAQTATDDLKLISLYFPVITCTLLSIRNMLPWMRVCVERTVVDEAGMIPLHQTFPLLVRSKKALIVGDPLQIQPIINQSDQTLERYHIESFTEKGLTTKDRCQYSPDEDTATSYHRAAGASGDKEDSGHGLMLREHRRCQPSIIAFCNQIAHYDLVCNTPIVPAPLKTNLLAYHVEGRIAKNVNVEEVNAVCEIVNHIHEKGGYQYEDIGVISFYRAQADALKRVLDKRYGRGLITVGTIHTFQGSERRAMILSAKACRQQDNISWFDTEPNLLNVAVSRAKDLFVLVGNLYKLESGNLAQALVSHIREHGIVVEHKPPVQVPDEYRTSQGCEVIYDCSHLDMLTKALEEAKDEIVVVVPAIRGAAAVVFAQAVDAVLKKGVKVTVIYGSPDNGIQAKAAGIDAEQAIRRLFARHPGARLQQIEGKGTNERILICDTQFAVIGSWDWLSHGNQSACQKAEIMAEVQIRRDISTCHYEPMFIEAIKQKIQAD